MAEQKKGAYGPLRDELSKKTTDALYQSQEYSKDQPPPRKSGLSREDVVLGWYELPGESISGHSAYKYDLERASDEGERLAKKYKAAGVPLSEQEVVRLGYAAQARERLKSGQGVAPHLKEAVERHAKYVPELDAEQALVAKKAGLPYVPWYVEPDANEVSREMQERAASGVAPRVKPGQRAMTQNQKILDTTLPPKKMWWER